MEANYEQLLQDSNLAMHFITTEVAHLDPHTLSKKTAPDKWSVIEIIDHLNLVYDKYLDNLSRAISEAQDLPAGQVQQRKTTLLGNLSVYSQKPKGNKRRFKMKTFDFFQPDADHQLGDILAAYEQKKEQFNDLIRQARHKDVARVKVPTALGEKVQFYLFQCLEFVIAHEQRHIVQIKGILEVVQ